MKCLITPDSDFFIWHFVKDELGFVHWKGNFLFKDFEFNTIPPLIAIMDFKVAFL